MRKALIILAGCGLALGTASCGKHDDAGSGTNLSSADNMLVPADENASDSALSNDAVANTGEANDAAIANSSAGTAPGATSAGAPPPAGSGGQ